MDKIIRRTATSGYCLASGYTEKDAFKMLYAYQDTGLEPEALHAAKAALDIARKYPAFLPKLKRYGEAESEGRLIVLPCKVGGTVWRIGPGISRARTVYPVKADNLQRIVMWMQCGDIGKTVFLTREEAEAALGGDGDG